MTRRQEKMIEDIVADTMESMINAVAKSVLNGMPVPTEMIEQKMLEDFTELFADLLADSLNQIANPPWYKKFYYWLEGK
jgi:hypothetical protein